MYTLKTVFLMLVALFSAASDLILSCGLIRNVIKNICQNALEIRVTSCHKSPMLGHGRTQ